VDRWTMTVVFGDHDPERLEEFAHALKAFADSHGQDLTAEIINTDTNEVRHIIEAY